ncbi:MAG TPA: ammonium transporter [Actinomycetota bacterium]|nr:ammonium transporter [Actinomycetota bacterium]
MLLAQEIFPEQVSVESFADNLLYVLAASAVVLVVAGLILIDLGTAKRRNVLDLTVQRFVGFLIGVLSYFIVGYAIWIWQFNSAFAVDNALWEAIQAWWIGGDALNTHAQNLDPALFPAHNTFQIFTAFLALYAGFICVLVHFAGSERLKALPYYIMCVGIGGVAYPFVLYLTWGSVSPLTTRGTHDFIGIFCAYIFAGTFAYMLARRLGPRAGVFKPHPSLGDRGAPYNLGLTTVGVTLLMFAIPFIALGCGYWIPDLGYFGISMTTSGLGVVFNNVFIAYAVGGVVGGLIAYHTKNVIHALLGPLAGYVAGNAALDVVSTWEMALIALFAPFFVWAVYEWLHRTGIDETKVIPLGLGAGIYGALVVGFVAWGDKTGGYFGLTEGTYAFQGAEINPFWQLVGIVVTMGIAILTGLILIVGLDKLIGIRVSDEEEVEGLDEAYWDVPPVGSDLPLARGR